MRPPLRLVVNVVHVTLVVGTKVKSDYNEIEGLAWNPSSIRLTEDRRFKMNAPKYFFARFGDPVPPAKDAVESGIYHPDPRHRPFPTEPGDVLLLYCSAAYREYPTQAPGLGIVLKIDEKSVYYRYLPLSQSVGKERIEGAFGLSEIKKFQNGKNWHSGLFAISGQSFAKAVGDREIRWP